MTTRPERKAIAPWTGLFVGAGGWFLHHQAGSDAVFWDCRLGGPLLTGLLGLVCGLLVLGGGVISWRARNPSAEAEDRPESHSFAGVVGAGAAGLFLLAIAFQTLSGFIIPACER
jgi:hypothetical protein